MKTKKGIVIYGIKNCDTMQKAFKWLDNHKMIYVFHNYKEEGISKEKLEEWLNHFETSVLINTKGTTYRNLDEKAKTSITNKGKAIKLMMENTSLIKRPVLETAQGILLGFREEDWTRLLS